MLNLMLGLELLAIAGAYKVETYRKGLRVYVPTLSLNKLRAEALEAMGWSHADTMANAWDYEC